MTFACMLRIKNEARWIADVLNSVLPLTESIYILDDHSTDETREICGHFPTVTVFESPFTGLDETRDKNWLLAQVPPVDWVLCIDGDEILEPGGAERIRNICQPRHAAGAYSLQVCYLWDRADQWRTDGVYGNF